MPFSEEQRFTASELRTSTKHILDCVENSYVAVIESRSRDDVVIICQSRFVDLLYAEHCLNSINNKRQ